MASSSNQSESASASASPRETLRQSMMFNLVIPALLLCGAVGVVLMLGTVQPQQRPSADTTRAGRLRALTPVRVERLRSLESTGRQLKLQVDGTVVPYRESRVAAEVAGRVIFKADECEAGNYVKRDQLLMRIDPIDYELQVQRLSRLQEQEYEALGEVDQEMANTKRLIDVAKRDVVLQQKEVDRQKALPEGFASRAEIDRAERALLAATQQLVTVENQLDLLRQRRVRLEASERLAATQLKVAELDLKRTEIRAPIDGVIVSEDADLNTFVARGSTLVTIEDTSKVEVATNLRMDQLYWVLDQQGERVDASARKYNLPETPAMIEYEMSGREGVVYRWKGRLLSYDGIGLDPVSRTVPVRVVVDEPTQSIDEEGNAAPASGATALVRGMYVRVILLIQPQTPLVVIPARALQPGNRVLQFVPDESVLAVATREVSGNAESEATPAEVPADATAGATANGGGSFHASQWEPGRVFVRRSVNPVDSLTLNDPGGARTQSAGSEFAGANRLWVCEARDTELTGGSYVVVSPLGSIDDGELPVRAERKGMLDDPFELKPGTSESAAAAGSALVRDPNPQDPKQTRVGDAEDAG